MLKIQHLFVKRWRDFAVNTSNLAIFNALITVGGVTLFVKFISVLKDASVAAFWGTSDVLDAFFIAFLLPSYAINVVAGAFNAALIPTFIQVRETEGFDAAQRLFAGVVSFAGGILLLFTLLLALVGPSILRNLVPGFSGDKFTLTVNLFYMMLPAIILNGIAIIWSGTLNAGERFALPAVANAIIPAVQTIMLFGIGRKWGIYVLAFGLVLGFLLQLYLLGLGLRQSGLYLRPEWHGLTPLLRQVIKQYLPMMAGTAIMSSTDLVDQSIASFLEPGSISVLNYGNKLTVLIISVGTAALSTAVLPYFSQMVARSDWKSIRYSLKSYSVLVLAVTIPLTLFILFLSMPLVRAFFQRGVFSTADTLAVSRVQSMYLFQIPFITLGMLFVRLISALRANYILLWGTLLNFVVNITLDFALFPIMGVAGIALSTSFVYIVSCIFLGCMLLRVLKQVEVKGV